MSKTSVAKTMRLSLAILIVAAAGLALSVTTANAHGGAQGALTDLQADSAQPTDGASAQLGLTVGEASTNATLAVSGLDAAAAGTTLGAHLHTGPCVAGDGGAAGPHYNSGGQPPATVNRQTEVWLDFTITDTGTGSALTTVPFVIPPGGANSLVIHEMATAADGSAGARWACLSLQQEAQAQPAPAPTAATAEAADETSAATDSSNEATTELAVTGSETDLLLAVGLALLGAGSAAVVVSRRSS